MHHVVTRLLDYGEKFLSNMRVYEILDLINEVPEIGMVRGILEILLNLSPQYRTDHWEKVVEWANEPMILIKDYSIDDDDDNDNDDEEIISLRTLYLYFI